jgi:hypothetical protein
MTEDAQQTVLSERTGGKCFPAGLAEPFVRLVVLDMRRVHQRDQHVDVQQKDRHDNSSRN